MTDWKGHITVDPDILAGKPIIKGARICVELIMDRLADGRTMEQLLDAYPGVTRDVEQASSRYLTQSNCAILCTS